MEIIDLVLILILFFFGFAGFFFGLISALGALAGTVLGAVIAWRYYPDFMHLIDIGNENLARVITFFILFVVASKVVSLAFYLIDKIYKFLSFIPFLKSINRIAGLVLGLIEGIIILSVTLVFVLRYPFADFLTPSLEASEVAGWLLHIGNIIVPLLPEFASQAKDAVDSATIPDINVPTSTSDILDSLKTVD